MRTSAKKRYTKVWLSGWRVDCGAILDQKTGKLSLPYAAHVLAETSIKELFASPDFGYNYGIKDFNPLRFQFTILDDDSDIDMLRKLLFLGRF